MKLLTWLPADLTPEELHLLNRLPAACYPALNLAGPHVCLILGDPYRRRRNHFRRYWHHLARSNPDCLLLDPAADLAALRQRRQKLRRYWKRLNWERRLSSRRHPPREATGGGDGSSPHKAAKPPASPAATRKSPLPHLPPPKLLIPNYSLLIRKAAA